jgi:hypothetical protein
MKCKPKPSCPNADYIQKIISDWKHYCSKKTQG